MCFGSSSKGEAREHNPPPRPVSAEKAKLSKPATAPRPVSVQKAKPTTPTTRPVKMVEDRYAPPPGPPPGYRFEPPPGPPPSHQAQYLPPPGPPPSHQGQYAPPAGPPPGREEQYAPPPGPPPSQHNWQAAVPDTSLLPPPPSMGYERSPTNNASEADANAAVAWLKNQPLQPPLQVIDQQAVARVDAGEVFLTKPPGFAGTISPVAPGHVRVKTNPRSPDASLISTTPLYSVEVHSPLNTERTKTIYYEVTFPPGRGDEISCAIGYVAMPYPPFRLPGWERASLGIHGDDGHRYVNDKWGGHDFARPFKRGETVGIGMKFSYRDVAAPPSYDGVVQTTATTPIDVEVFFTRNGQREGGWNIHEELDAREDLPVTGLEGLHDLYAAIGSFDSVEYEVKFARKDWLYQPS